MTTIGIFLSFVGVVIIFGAAFTLAYITCGSNKKKAK